MARPVTVDCLGVRVIQARGPRLADLCVKMNAVSSASVFSSRSRLVNCICTGYNCTCIQNAGLSRFQEMVEVCMNGRTDARCWSE